MPASAQTFNSGSTGADGALNLTTPGVVIFDPKSFNPPLDPEGDNVYHFTTITIGPNVIVKLTSKVPTGPIYWLASGNVVINGRIDLSGDNGHPKTTLSSERVFAAPGAGGFAGGVGGSIVAGQPQAQAGNGPGGGAVSPTAETSPGGNGAFTGNQFLTPLFGGSGGGGANRNAGANEFGGGGGGGGGALLIATSGTLLGNGTIDADGGVGGSGDCTQCGGHGAGGAIKIVAQNIDTNVILHARGGRSEARPNPGRIRVEFNTRNVFFGYVYPPPILSVPSNISLILPSTPPASIRVTKINNVTINSNPFTFPDITINTGSPVVVEIEARYIPVGTVPKIYVWSEVGPDQFVNAAPLAGTLALSTSTANITFPTGGSRGYVRATW